MFYSIPIRLLQFFGLLPLEFSYNTVSLTKKWMNWSKLVSLFLVYIIVRRTHITVLYHSNVYSGSSLYKKLSVLENYYVGAFYLCVIVTNFYESQVLIQKKLFKTLFQKFEIRHEEQFLLQTSGFATLFLTTNFTLRIFYFVAHNSAITVKEESFLYGILQSIFFMLVIMKMCLCQKLIWDELYLLEYKLLNQSCEKLSWRFCQRFHQITKALDKFEKLHKPTIFLLLLNVFADSASAIKGAQNIMNSCLQQSYDFELVKVIVLSIWSVHYMPPVIWLVHLREQINTKVNRMSSIYI